nr:MAG TPA: hypothetical protein [Caudoviricetes sp.]
MLVQYLRFSFIYPPYLSIRKKIKKVVKKSLLFLILKLLSNK